MHGECVCGTPTCREDARESKEITSSLLDLDKVCDKVWRTGLREALKQYGVKRRLLKAVQGLYKDSEATVKVGEEMTDWFEVQRKVKQGCPMSL